MPTNENQYADKEMNFLDHLEELRWRIIKSIIAIIVCAVFVGIFSDYIITNILLLPAKQTEPPLNIINLKPYGQVTLYLEVIIIGGVILSIPVIMYQFWKFIQPGLLMNERKYISSIIIFTILCFLLGVAFIYFIFLPIALGFFAKFGSSLIQNQIAVDEYLSFVLSMILVGGLVFELPVVSFFLAKLGILTNTFMKKYRRHAIVLILILAGILTPTPDIASQLLLGIPLLLLYEISILICKYTQKKPSELKT
ncbi:MAG: twin-arginine translocase subunit TatC [Ignavibacteria bacterium]|nr:twin-arginine translocase subunit TatC [Ignavibacteria bacterium]